MPVKKKASVIKNTSKSKAKVIKKNGAVMKQKRTTPEETALLIENNKLIKCKSKTIRKVIIPNGVTEIGEGAFSDCDRLTSIVIPEGVTKIGDRAFMGCSKLTKIILPDGVKEIGKKPFSGCANLRDIRIPKGVEKISKNALECCPFTPYIKVRKLSGVKACARSKPSTKKNK